MIDVLQTLLGLGIVSVPFLLIGLFKNTLKGFLMILTTLVLVHLLVGLLTQVFGIFTYTVVISIHTLIALLSMYLVLRYRHVWQLQIKEISIFLHSRFRKPFIYSSVFVLAVCVLLLSFIYFLRFNYTGPVDTVFGVKKVEHSSYTYPMYSDEWIGSALVTYSIREKSLPLVNPLNSNDPFINFLMATHVFFAEVILVLSLNPLTQYVHLADLNILFTCIALYLIQRKLGVGRIISSITSCSVILITNSGNLPGIWYILPFIISCTCLLYAILGHLTKSRYVLFVCTILSIVFYPPIIVLALPFFVGVTYGREIVFDKGYVTAVRIGLIAILGVGIVLLFSSAHFSLFEILKRALSFIIRNSLDSGKVIYAPWNVVPIFLIPGVLVGVHVLFRKKYYPLVFSFFSGVLFWVMYVFIHKVVIIEPSRIVVITAILSLMVSGLGTQYIWEKMRAGKVISENPEIISFYKVCVFGAFVFTAWTVLHYYPWHKSPMVVNVKDERQELIPSPPVTRYITESDIDIFKDYTMQRFISLPWKGLVIGVVTHNIPLESKSSTLTNRLVQYNKFMRSSCAEKRAMVKKYNINLVYGSKIDCPADFSVEKVSSEGLILYKPITYSTN